MFGRILPGYLGDKVGRFNVMIFTTLFSAILVLALWIPAQGNAPMILFAALFGFSSGTFVSLVPSLVAQISDIREIGRRNGTNFFIVAFAALSGNPLGGALIARDHGDYVWLQVFSGVTMAVGGFIYIAARHVQVGGFKWKKL